MFSLHRVSMLLKARRAHHPDSRRSVCPRPRRLNLAISSSLPAPFASVVWGFPKIKGSFLGVSMISKDYSTLGFILGSLILGNYHPSRFSSVF